MLCLHLLTVCVSHILQQTYGLCDLLTSVMCCLPLLMLCLPLSTVCVSHLSANLWPLCVAHLCYVLLTSGYALLTSFNSLCLTPFSKPMAFVLCSPLLCVAYLCLCFAYLFQQFVSHTFQQTYGLCALLTSVMRYLPLLTVPVSPSHLSVDLSPLLLPPPSSHSRSPVC